MMRQISKASTKAEYKASNVFSDILSLISLLKNLNKSVTKIKIEGLEALETELGRRVDRQDFWKLQSSLVFKNINKEDLNIPKDILANINEILLELKISVGEKSYPINSICDSIQQGNGIKYGVELIAYGKGGEKKRNFKMSWHLDKHIRGENNSDGRGKGFLHPEYHFNMGGFALTKEADFNFGDILLIDTPRIIHPPLDVVLGIDFVLNNFYGIRVKNLINSRQYKSIIFNAKRRLWRPYFICLANHWESKRFNDLEIQKDYANMILGDL